MSNYTLLTKNGINKLNLAMANNTNILLTHVAVGDGNEEITDDVTALGNETYRTTINSITTSKRDKNIMEIEAVIPANVGGFYVREAGIFCDDGSLFAVASVPETYKPLLEEGSAKDITLTFALQISNSKQITIVVDEAGALATKKYVDGKISDALNDSQNIQNAITQSVDLKINEAKPQIKDSIKNELSQSLSESLGESLMQSLTQGFGESQTLQNAINESVSSKITEATPALKDLIKNELSRSVGDNYSIFKKHFNQPLMQKVNPTTVKIPRGSAVCGRFLSEDKILSLEENLQGAEKVAGSDYFLYFAEDFFLSADDTLDNARLLGGFHYSLVPHDEAPSGRKTEEDMVKLRGINAYSIWDLNYRPSCNPRAMAKCGGVWYDIYMADVDYGLNFYGNPSNKIMGYLNDRSYSPKIPYHFGGNGTNTYGKLTWYIANEIVGLAGKELPDYNHYPVAAYGVAENHCANTEIISYHHVDYLTSKFGLEIATGYKYIFTRNIVSFFDKELFGYVDKTNGRGMMYCYDSFPSFLMVGGLRERYAGSHYLHHTKIGFDYTGSELALRGCCKHQEH